MWSKWQFFDFFSKTALTIWLKLGQNVEGIMCDHFQKTACRNLFWFIHKVWKSAENDGFLTFSQKWLVRFGWNLARMWRELFLTICKKPQVKSSFGSFKKSGNLISAIFDFWCFGFFSKSRIEILLKLCQNVGEIESEQTQETADLILFKKLTY